MDNREHMRWKTFEEYMKEAMECPDENTFEEIEDIVEMQLMVRFIYDLLVMNILFCYSKIFLDGGLR